MGTTAEARPRAMPRRHGQFDMGPVASDRRPISSQEARALAALLRENNQLTRLSLPQTYTAEMLAERFPGISIERIKRLSRLRLGYQPRRGQSFFLTLSQFKQLCDLVADGALEVVS